MLILAILVLSSGSSPGAPATNAESKPLRILFIGNSYTYVNELPEMLRQMSRTAKASRTVEYRMITPGGCTLEKHWSDGVARQAIAEGGWDYVVLQEQSLRPLSDPTNMFGFARLFDAEVRKVGARTVFYVTWARKNAPAQQNQITEAYSVMAKELTALSCPVGPAETKVSKARPDLELYQSDGSHPSPAATYLGACIFYEVLYGRSPVGFPARLAGGDPQKGPQILADLSASDAALLQEMAARTVEEWKGGKTPPEIGSSRN